MKQNSLITTKELPAFFCGMAALAALSEALGFSAMLQPYGLAIAVSQHLAVTGILTLWAWHAGRRRGGRFIVLLAIMVAAAGPFGAGIGLLAAIAYASPFIRLNASPSQWINNFLSEEKMTDSDRLHERIMFGLDNISESAIEPFQDILLGGTVLQKQMAIAKITRYFQPRFTPLLLQAVQDPNAAVRVQAATGLAKIEHDFMTQYLRQEKLCKDAANDNSLQLRIAEICDNYAHAGILDEESSRNLRAKAIAIYETCLAHQDSEKLRLALARLYLRQKQPEKTCKLLGGAVEQGTITPAALLWYMEALFLSGKLAQLREVAKHYVSMLRGFDGYQSLGETENIFGAWAAANAGEKTYAA